MDPNIIFLFLCSVHHFLLLISTPPVQYFGNDELHFLFETFGRSFILFLSSCLFALPGPNPSLYARLFPHFEGQGLLPPRDLFLDVAPDLPRLFRLTGWKIVELGEYTDI